MKNKDKMIEILALYPANTIFGASILTMEYLAITYKLQELTTTQRFDLYLATIETILDDKAAEISQMTGVNT
jgi:hypothetical protein